MVKLKLMFIPFLAFISASHPMEIDQLSLLLAARSGDLNTLKTILERNIPLQSNNLGETALQAAAQSKHFNCCECLMEHMLKIIKIPIDRDLKEQAVTIILCFKKMPPFKDLGPIVAHHVIQNALKERAEKSYGFKAVRTLPISKIKLRLLKKYFPLASGQSVKELGIQKLYEYRLWGRENPVQCGFSIVGVIFTVSLILQACMDLYAMAQ